MTDTTRLKDEITRSGYRLAFLAEKLSLSREGLYRKINGRNEFTASEIRKLSDILNFDRDKVDEIFLHTRVN